MECASNHDKACARSVAVDVLGNAVLGRGLTLSVRDGLVSLDAQDVTVRQILTEWARVGQTHIVNVERITGGPITLKLDAVPEKQALDIILRSIPGYMAMPRPTQVADASLYDRILIMPTTTAVAALRPQQPGPTFAGMQGGQNGNPTQLRQTQPTPLSPGMLFDSPNSADQMDDPAMAAAAAAGLVPVPALNPGPSPTLAPPTQPGPRTATCTDRSGSCECRPTRGTHRSERRSRVSLRRHQSNRRPLDGVCARRSPIARALLAIQFNRRPPATRHAHNNARN